jgi:FkbM family methyltransferase
MIKEFARKVLNVLHLDLTKNLKYDRLTKKLMSHNLKSGSNCIDVGCHKGEMLDLMLRYAPQGKHFAFEPIPEMYENLKIKYNGQAEILPYALSDKEGKTTFNYVKNAPAYSGIKKRKYDIENPEITEIEVKLAKLDDIIPQDIPIDFIKIDVEGAEYGVLKGGEKIISKYKPIVVFEFGLGASDYYGTKPEDIYNLLVRDYGLKISNLKDFINNKKPLTLDEFSDTYFNAKEYYFVAHR